MRPVKAESNVRKHGVTFDEASTVFKDPLAVIFDDEDHSDRENREIIIGHSLTGRLVIVSFMVTAQAPHPALSREESLAGGEHGRSDPEMARSC
ncbi:MAG: BrnT family toxin [Elusimicrobia bacterium]|nr:BrnT family toxin [Elusimicrobiota bacterium]